MVIKRVPKLITSIVTYSLCDILLQILYVAVFECACFISDMLSSSPLEIYDTFVVLPWSVSLFYYTVQKLQTQSQYTNCKNL